MAAPIVNEEYLNEIKKCREHLHTLISNDNWAPLMIRLAWHDAATYDAKTKTGGPNGSIRNEKENKRSASKGLKAAIDKCAEVKAQYRKITYADLYQLAGVVAVEVTGGPTIDFVPGRKDSMEPPEEGLLPDENKDASQLRDIFGHRMGLSDKDIVALCGGLTLGRAHLEGSGAETKDHLKFDNSYFKDQTGKPAKVLVGEKPADLPTVKVLVADTEFRKYVEIYEKDKEAFFKDYAEAHKKLSELGFTSTSWRSRLAANMSKIWKKGAVPIAVAAALLILIYFNEVSKRVGESSSKTSVT